jgi:benzylsuccinate CoA-transferase BbsF subunit
MFVGESVIAGQHRPSVRFGNDHEIWYPHGVYPCAGDDSWIAIAIRTEHDWRQLCTAMGNPAWCSDERLLNVGVRRRQRSRLDPHISAWTRSQDSTDLTERLQALGIAAERSMSAAEIVTDAHLADRRALVTLTHPEWGERVTVEGPWRFEGIPQLYSGWSEDMGSGNRHFLGEVLGHTDVELDVWSDEKAVY